MNLLAHGLILGGILGERLYQPHSDRPMHVAVFGSGSGTTLRAMLAAQKKYTTNNPPPFAIRLLFTDRECQFQTIAKEEGLYLIHHPWHRAIPREEYDRIGLEQLLTFSRDHGCPIDILLLAGYMRLMSSIWIRAFPHHILNMHPADLTILDKNNNRKFIGADAVLKALQEGEKKTRSTAILIDETVDGGPVLVSGPWVPYIGKHPITKEEAAKHQNKQKALSDWPACLTALELLAKGRVHLGSLHGELLLDGKPLPSCGYELAVREKPFGMIMNLSFGFICLIFKCFRPLFTLFASFGRVYRQTVVRENQENSE